MKKKFWMGVRFTALLLVGASVQSWGQSDFMPPLSNSGHPILTEWQTQGEYYGSQTQDTTKHLGAWLVAGDGTGNTPDNAYSLVVLPGGLLSLPGQPYGGWDQSTRYQGPGGPIAGNLNGKVYKVTTSSGGFSSDSITGTGENRTLYLHNGTTSYVLQRVKRHSPTFGLKATTIKSLAAAANVVPLFDSATGHADSANWTNQENGVQIKYGLLYRGIKTKAKFGKGLWHVEFFSCFNPAGVDQGRANSGIYQQGRYETQVLDNFGMNPGIDQYGAIYSIKAPPFNAELPPQVTHQTYDIYFTPRSGTNPSNPAYFTVYANGVKVQDSTIAAHQTTAPYVNDSDSTAQSLNLQQHGNEVVYDNIWFVPNATVHTLPYTSILQLVNAVSISHPFTIQPLIKNKGFAIPGINGDFDLTGRMLRMQKGVSLSIQPIK